MCGLRRNEARVKVDQTSGEKSKYGVLTQEKSKYGDLARRSPSRELGTGEVQVWKLGMGGQRGLGSSFSGLGSQVQGYKGVECLYTSSELPSAGSAAVGHP
ncbi:hypothetical protein ZIOFF_066763 [Zingiber officinale]|uniref:Uncharacterized protein n=1 Tax=Zingiber officinale TaxID=94328 RepID=A0A8J5KCB8_ZINOF|nr:hypothetical protein ZIOFF_066763 [Zingiber officinale]